MPLASNDGLFQSFDCLEQGRGTRGAQRPGRRTTLLKISQVSRREVELIQVHFGFLQLTYVGLCEFVADFGEKCRG
jgi:hypothetical protein